MKNSTIFIFTFFAASFLVWMTLREEKKAFQRARVIPVATVETSQVSEVSQPIELEARVPASIPHITTAPAAPAVHGPTQVEVASETNEVPEKTTLNLRLDEEILDAMEQAGSELRNYAAAEPTEAGWRIQIYPDDKIFAKAGFHDGDVVTLAGLQARSDNPDQARLAQRMVDILRMIER